MEARLTLAPVAIVLAAPAPLVVYSGSNVIDADAEMFHFTVTVPDAVVAIAGAIVVATMPAKAAKERSFFTFGPFTMRNVCAIHGRMRKALPKRYRQLPLAG